MYYKCPNCGQIYYSAAMLEGDLLNCEKCGAKVIPIQKDELKFMREKESQTTNKSFSNN